MNEAELIYDWNRQAGEARWPSHPEVMDLTLWEAGHAPGAALPSLGERIDLLHLLSDLGVEAACLGSADAWSWTDTQALLSELTESRLRLRPAVLCRPEREQLERVLEASENAGLTVLLETDTSPLLDQHDLTALRESVLYAAGNGLQVAVLCADAAQAPPDYLVRLWDSALDCGASRICLVDTTGWASPEGVHRLVGFAREVIRRRGNPDIGLDWHGFNDRGLALANALTAFECGVERVYASTFGMAERAGCVPLELLLINLRLLQAIERPMESLAAYCQRVALACKVEVHANYPVLGQDAFRTGTGVHAAAIVKAEKKGHSWLADLIYSGVPAGMFGYEQVIEVGPMAGESNVLFWLRKKGIEPTAERVSAILALAKASSKVLGDEELLEAIAAPAG